MRIKAGRRTRNRDALNRMRGIPVLTFAGRSIMDMDHLRSSPPRITRRVGFCQKISQHCTFAGNTGNTQHTISLLLSILWRKLRRTMTTSNFKLAGLHCTYRILNQGTRNNASFQVVLPNGRNVELFSKEGADECVGVVGTDFISTSLTATNDVELSFTYLMMLTVIDNVSPEKIASGIPESELRTFVEHTRDTLDTLSTDRNWLRSGTVPMYHGPLLRTIAIYSKHASFLKIFLSDEGMEAVAKFYASRKKNDTPDRDAALCILVLVKDALLGLIEEGATLEESATLEKALGIIEKSGLLGQ
jgi:hypothetical protein